MFNHACYSPWFNSHEGISANIKCLGIFFSTRATEGIEWCTDLNIGESDLFKQQRPAFTRKATGDSGCPEIDVPYRSLGNGFTVGYVAELEPPTGA